MRTRHSISYVLLVALLCGVTGTVHAEISGNPRPDGPVDTIIMGDAGITDGVDPIPQVWHRFRDLPDAWVLNPDGEDRGDGRPDLTFHRGSGWPVVVWAYNHGMTHDIVIAKWQGTGWGPIEFITTTAENEIDPRVFVRGNGTIDVVWWVEDTPPRVELTTREPDGDFWTPIRRISAIGEPGRRPTVAFHNAALWVAYERDATEMPFNTSEIVVRRANAEQNFVVEFIADSLYDDGLNPVLHVRGCRYWLDWRYSEDEFAYVEIPDSNSSGASLESWTDPSWIGLESVRLIIAGIVGQTPHTAPAEGEPLCAPTP